ncbi:hypothetical protein ABMA27_015904 [Loxostege sticticalis]|uniref:Uncharacterized protein n=1 Tax=Loxostege sticticalis TaxID=481309 RepID=A0ABR3I4V0_LOXSC
MALCVCKCLNVTLESEKVEQNIDIGKLELTTAEQRDIFFSENLLACPANLLKTVVVQQALVGQRAVGRWNLHSCLACGITTHALLHGKPDEPKIVLIPKSIQVIGSLSKQLNQTLQSQLEAVEDSVRQFRDQKYAEFEAYRERAQRDHKILASIVSKARSSNVDSEGWKLDTSIDNGPPSPQLPPLQRRRLSSIKDAKKISHHIPKPKRNYPPEEDSLDAEELFDLEGMDSRHNMVSDQDDYDSDDGSNDEGIHIARPRGGAGADIARSLPVDMPNFPHERPTHHDLDDEEDPQDIAASIKALARSVHGDVFELPRPRFSTQI